MLCRLSHVHLFYRVHVQLFLDEHSIQALLKCLSISKQIRQNNEQRKKQKTLKPMTKGRKQ